MNPQDRITENDHQTGINLLKACMQIPYFEHLARERNLKLRDTNDASKFETMAESLEVILLEYVDATLQALMIKVYGTPKSGELYGASTDEKYDTRNGITAFELGCDANYIDLSRIRLL